MANYEWIEITFSTKAKKHPLRAKSNLKREGIVEVLDTYIRDQIGKGEDNRRPSKKDIYHIKIKWFPENDRITVESDTGSEALTLGIILEYFKRIV